MNIIACIILLMMIFTGCKKIPPPLAQSNWQFIPARDDGKRLDRPLLYRALIPSHWVRKDPSPSESIIDTTRANCEFYIFDEDQKIRITIHTFPIQSDGIRIPPQAQIARWKKQFSDLNPLTTFVKPVSHGGFSGLFFEGSGLFEGKETIMLGWSMQLASLYERQLIQGKESFDLTKCADYTIKIYGPSKLLNRHRNSLLAFAQSFELIEELPYLN